MAKKFPHYRQLHARDCGAVCLRMIAEYYGRIYTTEQLMALTQQQQEGVSLLDISNAAEAIGMHTVGAKLSYERLKDDIPLPGIAHYKGDHFVVVVEAADQFVTLADPDSEGVVRVPVSVFLENWSGGGSIQDEGIILLMEPTASFFSQEVQPVEKRSLQHIRETILMHKPLLRILGFSLFALAMLMVSFPFVLQMIVDESIEHQNSNLLFVILAAWFILFICQIGMDFVKRFTLYHIGSKVNIQLITDFMIRVLQLPARYFETRMTEDVMQTLYDNPRVQRFLTRESASLVFGLFILSLFSIVLFAFDWKIFLVFAAISVIQGYTIKYFLDKRKPLNYTRHTLTATHYSNLYDLIRGVKEIKLNDAEKSRRWKWERSEAQLFKINNAYARSNELYLQIPYYLGELRNFLIIFIAASSVIKGEMTVGVLVAIIFILLQLDNPLKQIIEFGLGWMDTRMSLERMNEIHNLETDPHKVQVHTLPSQASLSGEQVYFRYPGSQSPWVLEKFDCSIPFGKTTVIIGPSGSGKTTLLNILLKLLDPIDGMVRLGDVKLSEIATQAWHKSCGVVQQDGHIFFDTIARNIALGDDVIDSDKLLTAARIANILPFLERLPDGFNTVIGEGGTGLSKGQRQSILIARAVYGNPSYLFLDEATNDLDAESERIVWQRIMHAFHGKTIVIFASRMNLPVRIDKTIQLAPHHPGIREKSATLKYQGGKKVPKEDSFDEVLFEN